MFILNIEWEATKKALETLPEAQQAAFKEVYDREYARLYEEVMIQRKQYIDAVYGGL